MATRPVETGIEVRPNTYAGVDLADVVHIVGAETIEEYS
jgi:hypothetical protein